LNSTQANTISNDTSLNAQAEITFEQIQDCIPQPNLRNQSLTLLNSNRDLSGSETEFESVRQTQSVHDLELDSRSEDEILNYRDRNRQRTSRSLTIETSEQILRKSKQDSQLPAPLRELLKTEQEYTQSPNQLIDGYKRKM
jgi:hypothetical protein